MTAWQQQAQHQPLTQLIEFLQTQPAGQLSPAVIYHQIEQLDHWNLYQHILQRQLQEPEITEADAQIALQALEKNLYRQHLENRLQALAQQLAHDPKAKEEYSQLLQERARYT